MNDIYKLIDKYEVNIPKVRKIYGLPEKYKEAGIKNLHVTMKHRLELIEYLNEIIQNFNWDSYHNFVKKERVEKTISENGVFMSSAMNANFTNSNAMINFIHLSLMSMFSMIISVTGMLAKILWLSLDLEVTNKSGKIIKNERGIKIKNVSHAIRNKYTSLCSKANLENHIIDNDCWFNDVRYIRNRCEHGDHAQIFVWFDDRVSALGNEPSGIPLVNKNLFQVSPGIPERRVNKYCRFIYDKLYTLLKDIFTFLTILDISERIHKKRSK